MKSNIRFILALFKLRLSRMMMYRLSFFGASFVDGSFFIIWLLMFNAIYSQVDSIGGWTKGQTVIFLGTFSLLNAFIMIFSFFGVITIPGKIISGEMDLYLTKPINPLFRLSFENINPGSLPLVPLSIGIIAYGIRLQGIQVKAGSWVLYMIYIMLMTILYYDLEVIIRTIPFLVISAGVERIEDAALNLCMRIPGVVFKGVYKFVFYFILPYGIMATIPTQIITESLSASMLLLAAAIVLFFTVFTLWFWRFGLRHYKSASS